MATYKAIVKTNHFSVTDAEKLKDIVNRIHCNGDKVHITKDEQKKNTFCMHAHGDILGIYPDENSPKDIVGPDFGLMVSEFQKILPDGEALILFELGTESLRYLIATATVVTKKDVRQIDLLNNALSAAREILGDFMWETQVDN